MAKHVIRYLLDGDGKVPHFVSDGGYFMIGEELIGISIDDEKRHLPSTVHKLTRAELISRMQQTCYDDEGNLINSEQASAKAESFLSQRGLSNYA